MNDNTLAISASAIVLDWDDTLASSTEDQYKAMLAAFQEVSRKHNLGCEEWLQDNFTLENFIALKKDKDPGKNYSRPQNLIRHLLDIQGNLDYTKIGMSKTARNLTYYSQSKAICIFSFSRYILYRLIHEV